MPAQVPRSADVLVDTILHNPGVLAEVMSDPERTLRRLAADATTQLPPPPLVREAGIYYIVVSALSAVALVAIVGALYLAATGTDAQLPETITALGAAAIGALAGLLAPSPAGK
jgi:hypothetical protein